MVLRWIIGSWGRVAKPDDQVELNGIPSPRSDIEKQTPSSPHTIEDHRPGYPRFSALISSAESFLIFRRFTRLRVRLLLLRQDRLSQLEQRLDEIDKAEKSALFLGMSRNDRNDERQKLFPEIASALEDYDKCAEATNRMLSYDNAESRNVTSLRNWVDSTGYIAVDETSYLDHERDLCSTANKTDDAMVQFESWVENGFRRYFPRFSYNSRRSISTNSDVYVYPGKAIGRIAKALLISLVTVLLLLPIVICNVITATAIRICVVMVSTIIYLLVLSGMTKAKTTELVVAATTYATVLIVFVSGADG